MGDGVPLTKARDILDHTDVSTTAVFYVVTASDAKPRGVGALEARFMAESVTSSVSTAATASPAADRLVKKD